MSAVSFFLRAFERVRGGITIIAHHAVPWCHHPIGIQQLAAGHDGAAHSAHRARVW